MASNLLLIGLLVVVTPSLAAQTGPLFDYGPTADDTSLVIGSQNYVEMDISLKFYGDQYNKIFISKDGHINFGEIPSTVLSKTFPFDYSQPDPPLAAVYYAEMDNTLVQEAEDAKSKVYYRKVERTDTVYPDILKELGYQVRINSVNDMSRFWPKRAVIATWHNVRHFGCRESKCPRNTYQAAIMTDDVWTYAIYNYRNITWRGGVAQKCNIDTGVGPDCFSAQVGFNAGFGREFTALPYSGSDLVHRLPENQGSKVKGRYIYQISTRKIFRDGCSSVERTLTVYPRETGMLGGNEVHIAGRCLEDTPKEVSCRVGTGLEMPATVLDTGRIACITPLQFRIGEAQITVVYDGQVYNDVIQVVPSRKTWNPVKLVDYGTKWLDRDPEKLEMFWEPRMLNGLYVHPENITIDPPPTNEVLIDRVIIALFGYAEITNGESTETVWRKLEELVINHENSGKFIFKPADHRCTADSQDCVWHIGAIKIVPADSDVEKSRGIFSDLFPMGWYIEDEMTKQHGEHWPDTLCDQWQDKADEKWEEELIECPCTRSQAYANTGQFIVDADCDATGPCPFHKDASICFTSRVPTLKGGQTQCCYQSIEGQADDSLIFSSAAESGGSFSAAANENGMYPYMRATKDYPLFSNWIMDKLPMVWCCIWSFDKDICLTHYEPKRKTPGCNRGQSMKSAFAFGDPHFQTFDGTYYTFNGYAEYWLLRVHDLPEPAHNIKLQARMENYIGIIRDLNATVITAVAMQQGNDDANTYPKISLILNPPLALDRISVFVNNIFQEFFSVDMRGYLDSNEKNRVYITRISDASFCNNFTVTFSNGASVNIAEDAGMLQVKVTAPPVFYEHTSGLFGFWDGDWSNDLRTRDGSVEVDPDNNKDVHEKFGADWAVQEKESVFHYFLGLDWQHYRQRISFTPMYEPIIPPGSNLTDDKVKEKCNSDRFCRFDYIATLNEGVASASLAAQTWANQLMDMSQKVDVCPYLDVQLSKREVDSSNLAGGQVTLTSCVEGYTLVGPTQFACVPQEGRDAAWAPAPSSTICKSNQQIAAEQQQTAVAIAVPITLVLLILLIAVAAFMIFKRKQAKEKTSHKTPLPADDLPRQQPPVNLNPSSLYTHPDAKLGSSKTSVSSHVSRGSNNSIILDQVIYPQRPPRPVSKTVPREEDISPGHYQNISDDQDPYDTINDSPTPPPADRDKRPEFNAPPPPSSGAYDNRGSDVYPDGEDFRQARSQGEVDFREARPADQQEG